ncbi:MAG: WD40-repeat-containing domain protein [Monoraphidium minutum]|nr:MAG: WD40-repeat-containing domain protein [Monoraphidium minutum]
MDFSESYKCSLTPVFSPDGVYVAAVVEYRLVIREVQSLNVVQLYSCLDKIHKLEWDSSSRYVLCGLYDRATVQVWSVDDPEWACKIDEGPAGVAHCMWAPDGLSVLLVADFCVRMTAWGLASRRCSYLPGPKHAAKGVAFDAGGGRMAVLERKECKDWVAVYDCSGGDGWALSSRFQVDTLDAADLAWSPDGSKIAIWDSPLAYKVAVHSPEDGGLLGSYSAYDDALGVKSAAWGPGGGVLALGSYDQVARALNPVTWRPLLECRHGSPVAGPAGAAVYEEVEEARGVLAPLQAQQAGGGAAGSPARREARARFAVRPLPAEITSVPPPKDKPNPKLGVGTLAWSPDGQLLATVNDNMPHALWVWDAPAAELAAVLVHAAPVRGAAWSPDGGALAAVTGGGRLYLWSPSGASVVHIPLPGFQACGVAWAQGGGALVLSDRDAFCCGYVGS